MISPTRFIVEQLITGFELAEEHVVHIPERHRPGAVAPCEHAERANGAAPAAGGVVGTGAVREGLPGARTGDAPTPGRVPEVSSVIAGRGSYLPELQTQVDVEGSATSSISRAS